MENSFFEYRDATGAEKDSDSDVIDDSLVLEESFTSKKKLGLSKVFIAESEESPSEDDSDDEIKDVKHSSNTASRRSSVAPTIISSSENEMSPEIVPRRRPPIKTNPNISNSSESFIGRPKNRKRMILIDSDTENSIVIEHNKNSKHACLKDTPAKINISDRCKYLNDEHITSASEDDLTSDDDERNEHKPDTSVSSGDGNDESNVEDVDSDRNKSNISNKPRVSDIPRTSDVDCNNELLKCSQNSGNSEDKIDTAENSEDNDTFDDGQMVMSRATRMSIMGFVPKETPSDDSDYIQSDDNSTRPGSANSLTELSDVNISPHKPSGPKNNEGDKDDNSSRITCSPFTSPLKDVTNGFDMSVKNENKTCSNDIKNDICDLTLDNSLTNSLRNKVLNRTQGHERNYKENVIDDDVTIIDNQPEVISLSSDDEEDIKDEKKSPNTRKSLSKKDVTPSKSQRVDSDIKQYLVPPSYPNQVVYVKKHVRQNELNKLEGLQADLHAIRHLLENMDMETLPDRGVKLIERLTALEQEVRRQGDKVSSMVVEPDNPTAADVAKDGIKTEGENKGLSWDDIQKVSNAVQPRMFGKQAMATHMAERNLIMDRLRDLHESLASRPPENELAEPPAALQTQLMPYQLHALAWLRWRETQRPPGGILADDMGLGKTITMISLIASDKDGNIDDDDDDEDHEHAGKGKAQMIRGGTLVVCPASLMQQWSQEVQKHCRAHRLSVSLHHGAARAVQPHRLASYDLVITTYNILLREAEKKGALCRVRWRRAILDEAHAVRNHKSATAAAVLPATLRARRRWALTGTPLHNRDLDLFALLRFLGCSPFDDLTMWKKWIDNKSLGGQERLSTIMRCIMLRRTKAQLQERGQLTCLPPRDVHERHVTLARDELKVYQKLLVFSKTLFGQFLHQRAEKRADAQGFVPAGKDSAYAEMHKKMIKLQGAKPVKSHEILVLLLRLRQVCCHCGLIAAMLSDDEAPIGELDTESAEKDLLDELNKLVLEDKRNETKSGDPKEVKKSEDEEEEGTTAAEAVRSVLARNNPVFSLEKRSSKIKAVMDCLNENVFPNAGEKAVVVSQWTGVLRLVERELARARVKCVVLSGQVPVPARAPLVDALNDPDSPVRVMLLSLTAGGVGLNLCGASHLLLLDPHWNPQLEQQAQDRVYRVGQHKHVHIYRFMCVDTVEQSIRRLQQVKLELADNVLTGARHNNASKLSIEDLKMLFNMGPVSG